MTDRNTSLFPIILTGKNYENGTFTYKFARGSQKLQGAKLAFNSISIFYSWVNISKKEYNNSTFQVVHPFGNTFKELNLDIPDGNYTIAQINQYLQKQLVINNLYLISPTGAYVYFMELLANESQYAIELRLYDIPTSLPVGYTNKGFEFPPVISKPTFICLNNSNFNLLLGFEKTAYMNSHISTFTPEMSPVSAVIIGCDIIENHLANPSSLLYSFTSTSVPYGSIISKEAQDLVFLNIKDGIYNSLSITLYDDKFNKLNIKDSSCVIYLLLKVYD